jgi:hypothetical protein
VGSRPVAKLTTRLAYGRLDEDGETT